MLHISLQFLLWQFMHSALIQNVSLMVWFLFNTPLPYNYKVLNSPRKPSKQYIPKENFIRHCNDHCEGESIKEIPLRHNFVHINSERMHFSLWNFLRFQCGIERENKLKEKFILIHIHENLILSSKDGNQTFCFIS